VGTKRSLERNPGLIDQELSNQVKFLQHNQADLSVQLDRLIKAHEIDKTTKMADNRNLINQITKLRTELANLRKSKSANAGRKMSATNNSVFTQSPSHQSGLQQTQDEKDLQA